MFAVPGWSVSSCKLKTQQEAKIRNDTEIRNGHDQLAKEEKKSKKRKRGHGKVNGSEVTKDNVAELWQKYIEGKIGSQSGREEAGPLPKKRKRQRKQKGMEGKYSLEAEKENHARGSRDEERVSHSGSKKPNGSDKRSRAATDSTPPSQNGKLSMEQRKSEDQSKTQPRKPVALPPSTAISKSKSSLAPSILPSAPPPIPSTAKLTPLQTAMRAKLISARFRHLNQTLYTNPSTHAFSLFSSNPEAFASYHAGFRAQVASWPSNPVDLFIDDIKTGAVVNGPRSQKQLWRAEKRKGGQKNKTKSQDEVTIGDDGPTDTTFTKVEPLPRHHQTKISTIIDLGCGDAHLHASLLPLASSLNLKIHSFDLAPGAGPNAHLVSVSDIAHLPLSDGSVDVAILCLALMGTNWLDFVTEAARVVRVGGQCWVGEVRSRFAGAKDLERLKGKTLDQKKKSKKIMKGGDEEDDDVKKLGVPMQVEEEEIVGSGKRGKSKEQETDVGPFMEVFRRRGFVLKGEVDMGNKMFVRMRFVRARSMVDGKAQWQGGSKFMKEDDGEVDPGMEAKVLKPCVYKTR
ncbi:MAG: hypothetical protein Q9166_001064 [cf. Caloplaca sp. 2 TL-2023]